MKITLRNAALLLFLVGCASSASALNTVLFTEFGDPNFSPVATELTSLGAEASSVSLDVSRISGVFGGTSTIAISTSTQGTQALLDSISSLPAIDTATGYGVAATLESRLSDYNGSRDSANLNDLINKLGSDLTGFSSPLPSISSDISTAVPYDRSVHSAAQSAQIDLTNLYTSLEQFVQTGNSLNSATEALSGSIDLLVTELLNRSEQLQNTRDQINCAGCQLSAGDELFIQQIDRTLNAINSVGAVLDTMSDSVSSLSRQLDSFADKGLALAKSTDSLRQQVSAAIASAPALSAFSVTGTPALIDTVGYDISYVGSSFSQDYVKAPPLFGAGVLTFFNGSGIVGTDTYSLVLTLERITTIDGLAPFEAEAEAVLTLVYQTTPFNEDPVASADRIFVRELGLNVAVFEGATAKFDLWGAVNSPFAIRDITVHPGYETLAFVERANVPEPSVLSLLVVSVIALGIASRIGA